MEGAIYPADESNDDFCSSILNRFSHSANEYHMNLCAVIGAMSQELKDQKLPTTPVAYFGATISSLNRISSEPESPVHLLDALLTIFSLLLPRISPAILKKERKLVSEVLIRSLHSPSLTVGAATSGLKCISHLLVINDNVNWSDISNLFNILLGFATDSRHEVRRQSHVSIRDFLLKSQKTHLPAEASEVITNTFKRSILFAGGKNTNSSEGSKEAQKVLYILDALQECIPHISGKCKMSILEYFKSLLKLQQSIVTNRLTYCLNMLCIHQSLDVPAELMVDLLCSIALSVSSSDVTADGLAFTARLLNVGMQKVYSVNRTICVTKLPVAFNALKDILLSGREEAIHAAINSLKGLTQVCIDESLIKDGVDHIVSLDTSTGSRTSGPTIIEKICSTIESLLDYHYTPIMDLVFQVFTSIFEKLGNYSTYLLRGAFSSFVDMQKLPDKDFPFRKELHECLGSALSAMGPETFLDILPLNLDAKDQSEANIWLLPILKQFTVGARLNYFLESIWSMIGEIKQKTVTLERRGQIVSSRNMDAVVYSLFSLLPSFCNYPLDTAECFKDLESILSVALREEPDVRGIICSSLQRLIQQNKRMLEGKSDLSCCEESIALKRAMARYNPQVAIDNLTAIKASGRELLSVLSSLFLKSATDDGGSLQLTIGEVASISDKDVVSRFFKSTMQKLLKVTQEASKPKDLKFSNSMEISSSTEEKSPSLLRAQLFDLAVSLLPGLNTKEIDLLFVAIKPALKDSEGLVQKKAYRVLSVILKNRDEFLSKRFDEFLALMIEVLPSCHFSAKRHRLDCLFFLIIQVSKEGSELRQYNIVSSFLTEIILALKEANKKTRNRAYDILVEIGHACTDEEKGGKVENLYHFFNMVAGGLAGETPHMISASMKGLARLAYEFSELVSLATNLLPSTFLLLQRKNREIIKANLGFLKVMVAKSSVDGLSMNLTSLVDGLLKWQDDTKNHFKSKVKSLLEMLVRKCGIDAVKAVMPEEHMRLLTNIRKIKERKERKTKSDDTKSLVSKATSRISRWNHTKIFSSFGDEESEDGADFSEDSDVELIEQRKGSSKLVSKAASLRSKSSRAKNFPDHLREQFEEDPLDLLDRHRTRSALQSSMSQKRKLSTDNEIEIDSEGRMIISEEEPKKTAARSNSDARSETGSLSSTINPRKTQKRRKTSDSGWAYTGTEYASKKASGDVKRKDKLEPYAYWPLDRKMMSRRPEHRAAARKGMARVVKMTKKLEGKSASSLVSSKGLKFKKGHKKIGKRKGRV